MRRPSALTRGRLAFNVRSNYYMRFCLVPTLLLLAALAVAVDVADAHDNRLTFRILFDADGSLMPDVMSNAVAGGSALISESEPVLPDGSRFVRVEHRELCNGDFCPLFLVRPDQKTIKFLARPEVNAYLLTGLGKWYGLTTKCGEKRVVVSVKRPTSVIDSIDVAASALCGE